MSFAPIYDGWHSPKAASARKKLIEDGIRLDETVRRASEDIGEAIRRSISPIRLDMHVDKAASGRRVTLVVTVQERSCVVVGVPVESGAPVKGRLNIDLDQARAERGLETALATSPNLT